MRAILDSIYSVDVEPETFEPDGPVFDVYVQFFVRDDQDGRGGETFDMQISSPAWIEQRVEAEGPSTLRHRLLSVAWNWDDLEAAASQAVGAVEADDWQGLYAGLESIGYGVDSRHVGLGFADEFGPADAALVRPRVRSIAAVGLDGSTWRPAEDAFSITVEIVVVGPVSSDEEARFEIDVVSPAWIASTVAVEGPILGHGLWAATGWQWERIQASIGRVVERSIGAEWLDCIAQISTFARRADHD